MSLIMLTQVLKEHMPNIGLLVQVFGRDACKVARLAFFMPLLENMAFFSTAWHKNFFGCIFLKCGIIVAFFKLFGIFLEKVAY